MDALTILKANKIRVTDSRQNLLSVLLANNHLTQKQIRDYADNRLDRVTLYRSLKLFLNKGIVSELHDDSGTNKFFLNTNGSKNHVHFKCNECGKLLELNAGGIRYSPLPQGYKPVKRSLFIVGICNKCTKKDKQAKKKLT